MPVSSRGESGLVFGGIGAAGVRGGERVDRGLELGHVGFAQGHILQERKWTGRLYRRHGRGSYWNQRCSNPTSSPPRRLETGCRRVRAAAAPRPLAPCGGARPRPKSYRAVEPAAVDAVVDGRSRGGYGGDGSGDARRPLRARGRRCGRGRTPRCVAAKSTGMFALPLVSVVAVEPLLEERARLQHPMSGVLAGEPARPARRLVAAVACSLVCAVRELAEMHHRLVRHKYANPPLRS